jgi:hypothetical protein
MQRLGWVPRHDLRSTLARTMQYYLDVAHDASIAGVASTTWYRTGRTRVGSSAFGATR